VKLAPLPFPALLQVLTAKSEKFVNPHWRNGMTAELTSNLVLSRKDYLDRIPGGKGWPIFGHTIQLLSDYRGLQNRMYAKHGSVHKLRVLGDDRVSLLGPEANELVLADKEQIFSSRLGWRSLETLLSGALMLRDFEEHRAHRKVMAPAFKISTLNEYLQSMQPMMSARLEDWCNKPPELFFPAVKEMLLEISMVVFLGEECGKDVKKLKDAFIAVVNATVSLIRAPIPGLAYKKGLECRRLLLDYIKANIKSRREGQGTDIFTRLCQATDKGNHWSDDEIAQHTVFVMGAAHDTTTSSICTMMWSLAMRPEWQQQLRQECADLQMESGYLKYDDLEKMLLAEYSFKEALRMYPPVVTINRCSIKSFTFKGYTVPANTMIALSPAFTHMMPEIWTDPAKFDPLRFSPERAEDKKHRFAWIPFGGGAHQCIGLNFAYIQMKSFVSQFLPRFEFSLPENYKANMAMLPIPKHKDGLPLKLKPL
jgi:cytochrome P450